MNHLDFMQCTVETYGPYQSKILEKLTYEYIQKNFQESELENIFGQLIIKVNPKFKTPPSPADFEEHFFRKNIIDIEIQAKSAYNDICRYSTMEPAIFSDPRCQAAIEMMGGWANFNNFSDEQIQMNTFCKYYRQFVENPTEIIPKEFKGSGNWYKPKTPQLIGDKDKCLEILNQGSFKQIDSDIFKRVD